MRLCDNCKRSLPLKQTVTSFDNARLGITQRYCAECRQALKEQNARDLLHVKQALAYLEEIYLPSVRAAAEPLQKFELYLHCDSTDIKKMQRLKLFPTAQITDH